MTKCPRCGKHKAIIDKIYGVLPCLVCQKEDTEFHLQEQPEFYSISKSNRVIEQRDHHAKDILQPFGRKGAPSKDFADAYPDKVHDYFSDSDLKKI